MAQRKTHDNRVPVREALDVLMRHRRDNQMVITNQGSARIWPTLSSHALDFNYNPSTMGGAIPLALGLALARPDDEVVVITGDGSLLMSLGCLVTVAAARPANLSIVVLDNGRYEVTGGQTTAGSTAQITFAEVARHCGFSSSYDIDQLETWIESWPKLLNTPGPRLISLRVAAASLADLHSPTPPITGQLDRLRDALTSGC
jgi:thiamine pyrophosphate-dependent acetolactate synthase large subunit-like protein